MRRRVRNAWALLLGTLASSTWLTNVCHAAPAFVQEATGFDYPVNQVQVTMNDVQADDLLVVAIRTGNLSTTTVTSTPAATWTKDVTQAASVGWNLDVWSAPNLPGGATTITIAKTGAAHSLRVIAVEYSGIASSHPAHKTSSGSGTSGTVDAGSVVTTADGCLLFAAAATDSDLLGWSAATGFTMRNSCNLNQEPDQKICTEDRGPVAAGTWSNGFGINADSWAAALVAYLPSDTGGMGGMAGTGGTVGGGQAGQGGSGDDSGCACRATRTDGSSRAIAVAMCFALALAARRRRHLDLARSDID
jgi:MYXO-CTERM domain-containing protein